MPPLAISPASPLHLPYTSPTSSSQVQLCVSVRTGKIRVAKVRLLKRALENRERGVVASLQASSAMGFLRSEAREG